MLAVMPEYITVPADLMTKFAEEKQRIGYLRIRLGTDKALL